LNIQGTYREKRNLEDGQERRKPEKRSPEVSDD
jgi:hypothetical protein